MYQTANTPHIWRYLPNFLTFLRLLGSPITLYFVLSNHLIMAFSVFVFSGITDLIDGYLARKWQVQSKFGQIFDPIADKLLMLVCFISLTFLGKIPHWFFYLVVGRDLLISIAGLIVLTLKLPIKLQPSLISKINTTFQILYIGFQLFSELANTFVSYNFISAVINYLMWATVITTIWSGFNYGVYFIRQFQSPTRKMI